MVTLSKVIDAGEEAEFLKVTVGMSSVCSWTNTDSTIITGKQIESGSEIVREVFCFDLGFLVVWGFFSQIEL